MESIVGSTRRGKHEGEMAQVESYFSFALLRTNIIQPLLSTGAGIKLTVCQHAYVHKAYTPTGKRSDSV